jgi:flavin-dependent dehydrogenase
MSGKVAVVGGGVVGLSLAKDLAMSGVEVDVYESKDDVRQGAAKASGIFSIEGLSRTGIPFKSAVINTLNGARLHAGGEVFTVSAKGTKAYILDRGMFAEICVEQAAKAGARIIFGKRLGKDGILALKDKYSVVVGADGAVSTVASACGFPPIKEYVLTYKAEYEKANIPDNHKVELFFSRRITNRFFGWAAPYSASKLEVGIGVSNRSGVSGYSAFKKLLLDSYVSVLLKNAHFSTGYASLIPIDSRSKTVSENVLLVGDAAGQVKATTGGGVIFGISCAKIAARCIEKHLESGAKLSDYESEWRRAYGLDLKLHKMLHSYYSNLGERRFRLMMRTAKLLGFEDFLGAYGDMDRPSVMFKRIVFRGAT